MTGNQAKDQIPVQDLSLFTGLCANIFSTDYLNFLPAILVLLLWHLLPIPEVATLGLSLWSLPLFTAGAAITLQKRPASLLNLIFSRCPAQGVFVLGYSFVAFTGFFIVLLFTDTFGWIGSVWGEVLTTLLMVVGTVTLMVRIWPDYLLRVIHPRYGLTDSWIDENFPYGLGPTVFTAWKYSVRAKLPILTIASALGSLFVVAGGMFFLHTNLFSGYGIIRFTGGILVLGLLFPIAHLVLVKAGYLLLSANSITIAPVMDTNSHPYTSSLPVSTDQTPIQIFDKNAPVDNRVFACVNRNDIEVITGWLIQEYNRKFNVLYLYNRKLKLIQIITGPWQTGHWGHEISGPINVSPADDFDWKYPQGICVSDKHIEIIKQYILTNVRN